MAEISVGQNLPEDINICYLAGEFLAAVIDGYDADTRPDGVVFVGLNVKVRALPKDLPVAHRESNREIILADIDTVTDENGRITDGQGNPWIAFVAPSASLTPQGSAPGEPWKVTVTISSASGYRFPQRSKTFVPLPSTPEEPLQWTDIIEVTPSTPAELEALQAVLAEVAAGRAGAESARDDALIVLEQVEEFAGTNNEQVAAMVASPGPTQTALAGTFARASFVRDIRDFVFEGETLNREKSGTSINVFLQRAVDALSEAYLAQSGAFGYIGFQVYIPNGLYRCTQSVNWRTGVGVRGESRPGVVIYPQGGATVIRGAYPEAGYHYDDCHFSDFTIDGKDQTAGAYTAQIKGIYIQYMRRAIFERVTVQNTLATGFGVDQLQGARFVDCDAIGNGRGIALFNRDPKASTGHSGFGIGTGGAAVEQVSIIGCVARGNGLYGVFSEKQSNESLFPRGLVVANCTLEGNWVGFKDAGSTGAIIQGNQILNNRYAGVSLDSTPLVDTAGGEGIISENVITGNGFDPFGYQGAGIVIGACQIGGYTIRGNEIFDNVGHGIYAIPTAVLGGRFLIDRNHVYRNTIDGIRFDGPASMAHLTGNTTHDNPGEGIRFAGAKTSVNVKLADNDCEDGLVIEHTMSGRYINERNIVSYAAPSGLVVTAFASTSVTMQWIAPGGTSGLTDYVVQYRTSPSGAWTTFAHSASTARSITITGHTTGTAYDFRVAAVVIGSTSPYSATTTGTPSLPPKYVDHFNRADGTLDGSIAADGPSSAPWVLSSDGSGVFGIVDGFAKAISGNGTAFATLNAGADGKVQATASFLAETLTVRRLSLVFRYQDPTNYWRITANPSGGTYQWRLSKVVGGTATILGTGPATAVAGDIVAAEFVGSTIRWWVNGALIGTVTDTALQTATRVGLLGQLNTTGGLSQDPKSKWDDFIFFGE